MRSFATKALEMETLPPKNLKFSSCKLKPERNFQVLENGLQIQVEIRVLFTKSGIEYRITGL